VVFDEYNPYFAGYVQRVPEGSDIFAVLGNQPGELRTLLQNSQMHRPIIAPHRASGA
jgi:hypothetical protein